MTKSLVLRGHRGCINTCSFNPYGDLQLTGCDDGSVWLWDIGSRAEDPKMRFQPHLSNVFTTNFLTGNRFLSGGNDASVQVIEVLPDGTAQTTRYDKHHIRKVHSSFVIDESTFVTCSHDCTVRIFDIRTGYRNQITRPLPVLTGDDFNYEAHVKLTQDIVENGLQGQHEGGGLSRPVSPAEIDDGTLLLDFKSRRGAGFYQIDVHPLDRKRFLTTGCDGTVRLFDMRMIRRGNIGNAGFSVNAHYGEQMKVTGATFSDTGDRIAASVIGGNIHVLDTESFVDLATIPPLRRYMDDGSDGPRRMRRPPPEKVTGELIELKGHRSESTIKTCNWFGKFVVTGTDNGTVYFYDPENGKIVNILEGHDSNVNVVAVHREKKLLATSGVDDYATLWEPDQVSRADLSAIDEEMERIRREEDMNRSLPCSVM
jgi:WD40 repeat protein